MNNEQLVIALEEHVFKAQLERGRTLFRRLGFQSEEMALALFLWLCSLPLVAIVVIPLFGRQAAAIVALILFLAAMALCWGICGWKVYQ
ncbi:MAG: hypothetical protein AB1791_13235, partial [Chloroflexota bacterium]